MSSTEKFRDEILGILERYGQDVKIQLAAELARRLADILGKPGADFSSALREILGRELTSTEQYKAEKLQDAYRRYPPEAKPSDVR